MATQLEKPPFDASYFQQRLPALYRAILRDFRRIGSSFFLFNLFFFLLFALELFGFLSALPVLSRSTVMAAALSCMFLTVFSYFILLFYHQAKRPEQLVQIKDSFLGSLRQAIGLPAGETEHHLSLSASLLKLASYLDDFEWTFYPVPRLFQPLKKSISTLSAFFHWQDVFRLKQILLLAAIEEHLRQIRLTPTDLELHASLANAYIAFSRLFIEPKCPFASRSYRKKRDSFEETFRAASSLAIEEFQILNHYAPNDPWVHEQLAAGYRDLRMPDQEIKEVETLLKLRPQNNDLLFRLGTLYFEQGCNAKGLKIYEELKISHYKKAEDLISAYGQLQSSSFSRE